jgi:hypothetical protein
MVHLLRAEHAVLAGENGPTFLPPQTIEGLTMTKWKTALMMIALALASVAIGQQRLGVFDAGIGGNQSQLNVTSAGVINARPCVLWTVIVANAGAGDSSLLTINDATTVGGAASSNVVLSVASSSLVAGQIIQVKVPIMSGIVVSSVPGGGASFNISYSCCAWSAAVPRAKSGSARARSPSGNVTGSRTSCNVTVRPGVGLSTIAAVCRLPPAGSVSRIGADLALA